MSDFPESYLIGAARKLLEEKSFTNIMTNNQKLLADRLGTAKLLLSAGINHCLTQIDAKSK